MSSPMMTITRGIGLIVPVVFVLTLALSQTFTDLFNKISVFWGFFLVGLVAGLLIRAWWSVAVVPGLLVGPILIVAALVPEDPAARGSSEIDSPIGWILLFVFNLILPSAVGAAIGSLAGALVRSDANV